MILITFYILSFILMVVISNIISAPVKIGQKMMSITKYLVNWFIFIAKPIIRLVMLIIRLALFIISLVFACVFGLLTFGFAFSPIMNLYRVLDTQLSMFAMSINTGFSFVDKNVNIIEPVIDKGLSYVVSIADFLYHSIKKH